MHQYTVHVAERTSSMCICCKDIFTNILLCRQSEICQFQMDRASILHSFCISFGTKGLLVCFYLCNLSICSHKCFEKPCITTKSRNLNRFNVFLSLKVRHKTTSLVLPFQWIRCKKIFEFPFWNEIATYNRYFFCNV